MDAERKQLRFLFSLAVLLSCTLVMVILMDSPGFPLPSFVLEEVGIPAFTTDREKITVAERIVNINTATKAELETLPGVGDVTAQRIIEYRNTIGGFTSVEQLLEVERIGEKTLDKLRPYLIL